MFNKISAAVDLFRKGSEVAHVELWKTGGIRVSSVAAFLGALATAASVFFGFHVEISQEQLIGLSTGLVTLVGVVLPAITSKRAGILPAKFDNPAPIEDHSFPSAVPAVEQAAAPAVVQPKPEPNPHTAARVGEQFVDSENPLAGLDTTYRF